MKNLGPDVPLHFTAFHPDYKMNDVAATPAATLTRAREIALAEGLHYVYTGNVHDVEGGATCCPSCKSALIVRDWYRIDSCRVTPDGSCPDCGHAVAGRFGKFTRAFGPRRIPVAIHQSW
jgi:pyruvate formate lyase activating enzyme